MSSKPGGATASLRGRDEQTDDFLQRLSARLRAARARRGMTRSSLARDAGISQRYLAQLETGEANPSVAVLRELSVAMDMPLSELLAENSATGASDQTGSDQLQRITQLLARLPAAELARRWR